MNTFNSLSRDHIYLCSLQGPASEQRSFNSLSRDHKTLYSLTVLTKKYYAFNTLSRDHLRSRARGLPAEAAFNTLSRDHLRQFAQVVNLPRFQHPLSGSPSPIPGFFGSPRLSAAAPFRTNDFKGHYLDISFRPFIRGL